jgi:Histidine kinase-like ATPase domain
MSSDHGLSQAPPSAGTAVLNQAFDRDSLYALRTAVAAHAAEAGLSRQQVYDVVTAAHELAANAVRHGAGHGQLLLWADGRALHCQVSDPGGADHDSTRADAPAWSRPPDCVSGRYKACGSGQRECSATRYKLGGPLWPQAARAPGEAVRAEKAWALRASTSPSLWTNRPATTFFFPEARVTGWWRHSCGGLSRLRSGEGRRRTLRAPGRRGPVPSQAEAVRTGGWPS